jgi:ketosteroid isomerase-like protein
MRALLLASVVLFSVAAMAAEQKPLPPAVRIPAPPECPPYKVKPGTPVSTAAETRALMERYFALGKEQNVEKMDSLMAPDATIWFAGTGCFDRSQWGPMHYSDRPASVYVGVEFVSLLVEGDHAVLAMSTEQAWPGGGYHKQHSIHAWVSGGKIVQIRQYSVDVKPPGTKPAN